MDPRLARADNCWRSRRKSRLSVTGDVHVMPAPRNPAGKMFETDLNDAGKATPRSSSTAGQLMWCDSGGQGIAGRTSGTNSSQKAFRGISGKSSLCIGSTGKRVRCFLLHLRSQSKHDLNGLLDLSVNPFLPPTVISDEQKAHQLRRNASQPILRCHQQNKPTPSLRSSSSEKSL